MTSRLRVALVHLKNNNGHVSHGFVGIFFVKNRYDLCDMIDELTDPNDCAFIFVDDCRAGGGIYFADPKASIASGDEEDSLNEGELTESLIEKVINANDHKKWQSVVPEGYGWLPGIVGFYDTKTEHLSYNDPKQIKVNQAKLSKF